jgi:hypothetical protein
MTTRETMMALATQVNELRAAIKAARGTKRQTLTLTLATIEPQFRIAQRAYLAEQRASKQVA